MCLSTEYYTIMIIPILFLLINVAYVTHGYGSIVMSLYTYLFCLNFNNINLAVALRHRKYRRLL